MCRVTRSWAPSLSTPVASPVAASRTITPSAGSGVLSVDAGQAEGRRVRPAGVAVVAAHERGTVGDDRVEQGAVGQPAGERDVQPALAEDPGRVRSGRRVPGDRGLDAFDRPQPEQVDPIELVGALADVDVASSKPAVISPPWPRPPPSRVRATRAGPRPSRPTQAIRPSRTAIALAAPTGRGPTSEPWGTRSRRPVCDEDAATDDQQVGGSLTPGQACLEGGLDRRPFRGDHAEIGGIAERTVGHDRVAPEDPLERRADAGQRVARALVAGVGLELDPVGAERLERVGQLEQLRLAVGAGPLERATDPGPADLEALVFRHDRHEPAAADRPSRGAIDRGERPFRAGFRVGHRGLDPALQAGLVLGAHDRPLPERGIEGDEGEVGQVVATERLQADPRPLQDDRFDPRL